LKEEPVIQEPKIEDNRKDSVETAKDEKAQPITADEKVAAWNKKHPIGTRVKSMIMDDDNLETRTKAVVLFGHRAAVYMKNYNGYFDLDEIKVISN
jgi:malonyl CoA-acyl carrier protein transacylase